MHQSVVIKYCGRHRMKGIGKSVNLYQVGALLPPTATCQFRASYLALI
jgi:hypothetical protein